MTDEPQPSSSADTEARRRAEAARRRRLEAVFGTSTGASSDESGRAWGEADDARARDEQLRREVPPHHGSH